jgi:hypothetical protein
MAYLYDASDQISDFCHQQLLRKMRRQISWTDGRQKSDIWSQASYRYPISWEAFLEPSDSYFLFAELVGFYTHWTYMHIFRHICSMCIKINKIAKQEVGIWWIQKHFPRYGVPIWSLWPNIISLSSIVAEKNVTKDVHICSMCIDTNRFLTRQIPTSCLPKSGGIIGEH